ncbi:flavodoxin domain-containing protein [Algiphilus sp.]|uniref:flavodoxin domain-containing protein n=1 Tax=Algiphilus sp. TaxID=1872431 RepID=UPI003C647736
MPHVLIVYATSEGQTEKIAGYMAGRLRARGIQARALDVYAIADIASLTGQSAVVVGGSVHAGRFQPALERFVGRFRAQLSAHPLTAFFSVSGTASRPEGEPCAREFTDRFLREADWKPTTVACFGGAIKYPRYDPVVRRLLRRITARAGGGTDLHREYEYTDWDRVDAFADRFLTLADGSAGHGS